MEDSTEQAVIRAIAAMRANLSEPLSVDDMARAAMFSKFHFTRIFQRVTGVSPGRFLSALRLQHAKHLLVSTSLNVADISMRVGYNSVGTFSSRFSRSVGMSPKAYRRMAGFAAHIPTAAGEELTSTARISGGLALADPTDPFPGLVFIGLFPGRIPEGYPCRCAVLDQQTSYQFDRVPEGTWYLHAQCVAGDPVAPLTDAGGREHPVSVATRGPLTFVPGTSLTADLTLRPARTLDPPVLMALLDVRRLALRRAAGPWPVDTAPALVSRQPFEPQAQRPAA